VHPAFVAERLEAVALTTSSPTQTSPPFPKILSCRRGNAHPFGSYARGDWVEDLPNQYFSDYDSMVVVATDAQAKHSALAALAPARPLTAQKRYFVERTVVEIERARGGHAVVFAGRQRMEADFLRFDWGVRATVRIAEKQLMWIPP
jgi:hypothetical protein